MSKTELFDHILQTVAEETELSEVRILSQRRDEETVNARYLLVYFLCDAGFSSSRIASLVGMTRRNITDILTKFDVRCSIRKLLRMNYENLKGKFWKGESEKSI